jgi:nucleolin
MDFKSIIGKLDSMETPLQTPAAPILEKAVQLNEDAQLRVLSGRTSYIEEAKKKAEEDVKEEMKVGDKKPSATGGTIEKTATGIKHHAGNKYGGSKSETDSDDEDDKPAKKKAKKESVDPEQFKAKFKQMVEAKKEDAKKKKEKKVDEAAKPDFLDIDKDGDKKEPMKKAAAEKGDSKKDGGESKGLSAKQKKLPPGLQKAIAKKKGTAESVKTSKKVVAESVESKLSFKDMVRLVQESGGQQQIDAIDKELFNWANRVAVSKLGEGMKAELYAGLIYERNGGVFEMYDVLSETKK